MLRSMVLNGERTPPLLHGRGHAMHAPTKLPNLGASRAPTDSQAQTTYLKQGDKVRNPSNCVAARVKPVLVVFGH